MGCIFCIAFVLILECILIKHIVEELFLKTEMVYLLSIDGARVSISILSQKFLNFAETPSNFASIFVHQLGNLYLNI